MGNRLLKLFLAGLLGLVLGYAAALGIGLLAFEVFAVSQREGANAMGLAFFIAPTAGLVTAAIAAAWSWRRSGAAAVRGAHPAEATPARGPGRRLMAAAGGAIAGWLAGTLLQWVLAGQSYETFVVALAVAWAPWLGALALGGATWGASGAKR
ncbi:MAG: hypothetical protein U1E23_01670 [Reyranellaceae bacterium]